MRKLAFLSSLFAFSMFAAEWSGTISDSKCAKAHADASEKSAKCAQTCVKNGQQAVLVTSDNQVYKIANQDSVKNHVGHKVTVEGKLDGDTVTVDSVKM